MLSNENHNFEADSLSTAARVNRDGPVSVGAFREIAPRALLGTKLSVFGRDGTRLFPLCL